MTRLVYKDGILKDYLSRSRQVTGLNLEKLASKLEISSRTLRDWQREKYLPSKDILDKISTLSNLPLPTPIETRENWWSGRVNGPAGAKARLKKYGCSFPIEKRRLGGHNSQMNRKLDPEYYAKLGCPIPREFLFPNTSSIELAEFIGILLGDGCIQPQQVSITLNTVADQDYIRYVVNQIQKMFSYTPTVRERWPTRATTILLSGKNFTDNLIKLGMKIGDKVRQQVDVPQWIKDSHELSKWCLRGLMDTDGGIFTNSYKVNGKTYVYPKTCFTNASQPLLDFVYHTLIDNGFHPNNKVTRKIWLHSQAESIQYLRVFGSSNQRLLKKIR